MADYLTDLSCTQISVSSIRLSWKINSTYFENSSYTFDSFIINAISEDGFENYNYIPTVGETNIDQNNYSFIFYNLTLNNFYNFTIILKYYLSGSLEISTTQSFTSTNGPLFFGLDIPSAVNVIINSSTSLTVSWNLLNNFATTTDIYIGDDDPPYQLIQSNVPINQSASRQSVTFTTTLSQYQNLNKKIGIQSKAGIYESSITLFSLSIPTFEEPSLVLSIVGTPDLGSIRFSWTPYVANNTMKLFYTKYGLFQPEWFPILQSQFNQIVINGGSASFGVELSPSFGYSFYLENISTGAISNTINLQGWPTYPIVDLSGVAVVTNTSNNTIVLRWTAPQYSDTDTLYKITATSGGSPINLDNVIVTLDTSDPLITKAQYILNQSNDVNLMYGFQYSIRIFYSFGNILSDPSNIINVLMTKIVPPPTNLVGNYQDGNLNLDWDKPNINDNITAYKISYALADSNIFTDLSLTNLDITNLNITAVNERYNYIINSSTFASVPFTNNTYKIALKAVDATESESSITVIQFNYDSYLIDSYGIITFQSIVEATSFAEVYNDGNVPAGSNASNFYLKYNTTSLNGQLIFIYKVDNLSGFNVGNTDISSYVSAPYKDYRNNAIINISFQQPNALNYYINNFPFKNYENDIIFIDSITNIPINKLASFDISNNLNDPTNNIIYYKLINSNKSKSVISCKNAITIPSQVLANNYADSCNLQILLVQNTTDISLSYTYDYTIIQKAIIANNINTFDASSYYIPYPLSNPLPFDTSSFTITNLNIGDSIALNIYSNYYGINFLPSQFDFQVGAPSIPTDLSFNQNGNEQATFTWTIPTYSGPSGTNATDLSSWCQFTITPLSLNYDTGEIGISPFITFFPLDNTLTKDPSNNNLALITITNLINGRSYDWNIQSYCYFNTMPIINNMPVNTFTNYLEQISGINKIITPPIGVPDLPVLQITEGNNQVQFTWNKPNSYGFDISYYNLYFLSNTLSPNVQSDNTDNTDNPIYSNSIPIPRQILYDSQQKIKTFTSRDGTSDSGIQLPPDPNLPGYYLKIDSSYNLILGVDISQNIDQFGRVVNNYLLNDNISNGTTYKVLITGTNENGDNKNELGKYVTITPGLSSNLPSVPINFIATNISYNSINLIWAPPINLGSPAFTQYGLIIDSSTNLINSSINSYTVNNLIGGTTYNFQLYAKNINGNGAIATLQATTTPYTSNTPLPPGQSSYNILINGQIVNIIPTTTLTSSLNNEIIVLNNSTYYSSPTLIIYIDRDISGDTGIINSTIKAATSEITNVIFSTSETKTKLTQVGQIQLLDGSNIIDISNSNIQFQALTSELSVSNKIALVTVTNPTSNELSTGIYAKFYFKLIDPTGNGSFVTSGFTLPFYFESKQMKTTTDVLSVSKYNISTDTYDPITNAIKEVYPLFSFDLNTNSSYIVQQQVPDPPTTVVVYQTTTHVNVSFLVPSFIGSGPITSYKVSVFKNGSINKTITGTLSPIMIPSLTIGTTYSFYVTAINSFGESSPSSTKIYKPTGSGTITGDPHITTIYGENYFLPNVNGRFLLFNNKNPEYNLYITTDCYFLTKEEIEKAPFITNYLTNYTFMRTVNIKFRNQSIDIDMNTLEVTYKNSNNIIINSIVSDKMVLSKFYSENKRKELGDVLQFNGKSRKIELTYKDIIYTITVAADLGCADHRNDINIEGPNMESGYGAIISPNHVAKITNL